MFESVIVATIIGIMIGFVACLMQKETYDSDLVQWNVLEEDF